MKLKKLTIHNIASIEEAMIDFANGPLAEESIFLICGETGAGKSTILDAICLALYKDTPRMKRTNREAYQDPTITSLDHVQTNDCRQLVRRNAKEAWVELEFEDQEEITYTARWSVDRARTGNLKKAEWQLYNHRTDESLHKDAEIESTIRRIIGLDFEQFCRTTLLAQGEFTRFLQSNSHEKADILERLTNTDIYSQIGTRIFDCWKEHKTNYETQKIKLEQVHLLSDEKKNELRSSITIKEKEIHALQLQLETMTIQLQWLVQEQQLTDKIKDAYQTYESTQKALQSDGFQEAEKLLKDWDLSAEARTHYRESQRLQQQFKSEENELQGLIHKIHLLHPDCPPNTPLLPLLEKEEEGYRLHCQKLQQAIAVLQTEIAQQEEHLRAWKLEEKEIRKEELQKQLEQLKELQNRFSQLEEKKKLQQESEAEISTLQQQLANLKEQSESLLKEVNETEQKRLMQERLVLKLKEATENWAKEARRKLTEGDQCPVCGQTIAHLFSDETFQSQLEGPEKELEELRKQEDNIRNRFNRIVAEENQHRHTCQRMVNKQLEALKVLQSLQQEIEDTSKALQLPEASLKAVGTAISTRNEESATISQALKSGKEMMQAIANKQKDTQQLQQVWTKENEKRHACRLRIESYHSLNEQSKALRKRQEATQSEVNALQQKVHTFVTTHPSISIDRLCKLVSYPEEKVQNMRQRMQQTREDCIKKETTLRNLQKEQEDFRKKKPLFPPECTPFGLNQQKEEEEKKLRLLFQEIGQLKQTLQQDNEARIRQEKELKQLKESYQTYQQWTRLKELFGSADGKTFRAIAQSFILKELLQNANFYLKHFTDRYQLEGQGITLTILLRDFYEGGITRPVSTLSGGESFLISLALALGLSSLNREQLSIATLFIDEGFGTLSSDYLQTVMDTLEKLHQLGGKRVGIISHVEGLRERIRTQIQVRRIDNSRSEVVVV